MDTISATTSELTVSAYDRSGFAFSEQSPYGTASGAYNGDGTLKSGAQVIYVTADNAKTVTATVNGATVTGFQAILAAKQKSTATEILDIRIVGCVTADDVDYFGSSSEGIQIKGASAQQNMNITVEGVGEDATVHGYGFLIRNCGNVEVRNIGLMDYMDDGISIDTSNCNLWIHNVDLFYGQAGSDADQKKGDGSLDIKKSQYCTVSYVHFWDSGKSSLLDASSATSGYVDYITFHHNWFDHSDSRCPRIRNGKNFHIYNNYYDGVSKYGVGVTCASSAFVESNYFRDTKYPMLISGQGSDKYDTSTGTYTATGTFSGEAGGIIKAYNNEFSGTVKRLVYQNVDNDNSNGATDAKDSTEFDAYLVTDKNTTISSDVATKVGGTTYSNFDTSSDMYSYTADSASEAKEKVETYAGRMNGGDFRFDFSGKEYTQNSETVSADEYYGVDTELKDSVVNYTTSLISIGGLADGCLMSRPHRRN